MSGFFGGGGSGGSTITSDTLANIEALTPTEGDLGFPTDSPYTLICRSAGTWSYRFPGVGFDVTKPPSAGWTAYASGSVASSGGMRVLTLPAEAGFPNRGEYRARPSDPTTTPYFVEFGIMRAWDGSGSACGFTDGTGIAHLICSSLTVAVQRWAAFSTFTAADATIDADISYPLFMRIEEDATNRHFFMGLGVGNSIQWIEVGAGFGRTVTITATSVGWWGIDNNTASERTIGLFHYKEGAL